MPYYLSHVNRKLKTVSNVFPVANADVRQSIKEHLLDYGTFVSCCNYEYVYLITRTRYKHSPAAIKGYLRRKINEEDYLVDLVNDLPNQLEMDFGN